MSDGTYDVKRTEGQWRRLLSPEEFRVLRQAGTEAPFTGEYTDTTTEGVYSCRACSAESTPTSRYIVPPPKSASRFAGTTGRSAGPTRCSAPVMAA